MSRLFRIGPRRCNHGTRCYSSGARSGPISDKEFSDAVFSIWTPEEQQVHHKEKHRGNLFRKIDAKEERIGLAISGGVDSMSLAFLCKRFAEQQRNSNISFTAFVVDHRIRSNSAEEAAWVANELHAKFDIRPWLLPLEWPIDLPENIEPLARRLRFRAIGSKARDLGINKILFAQHSDDVAETVLMRMIMGRTGSYALKGMRPIQEIPECYDMHGVWQSGGLDFGSYREAIKKQPVGNARSRIERGGIQILRPLLPFSKERLIATCQKNKIAWAEDPTNSDPKLTIRNAIRHTYANHELPTALTKPKILDIAKRASEEVAMNEKVAADLFRDCTMKLDIRSGTAIIQFPEDRAWYEKVNGNPKIRAALLRKMLLLVSANHHIELPNLDNTAATVFSGQTSLKRGDLRNLTISSVHIFEAHTHHESMQSMLPHHGFVKKNSAFIFSRQPFRESYGDGESIVIPSMTPDEKPKWQLFDGRYWIKVKNPAGDHRFLAIQSLGRTDIKKLRDKLDTQTKKKLNSLINQTAAKNIRLTLPAIVAIGAEKRDEAWKNHVNGITKGIHYVPKMIVAVPTLGAVFGDNVGEAEWEWRYKDIGDFPGEVQEFYKSDRVSQKFFRERDEARLQYD